MDNDVASIMSNITPLFKRLSHTRYWIQIANNPFDRCYNFYFNQQRGREPLRSTALYTCVNYDLNSLESLVTRLRHETQLTFVFAAFDDAKWPRAQTRIERKASDLE